MATVVTDEKVAQLIRSFGELGRQDVAFAGGKGANLGELTRAGFTVPPGFVVGAPAYAAFVATGGPRARIAERLGSRRRRLDALQRARTTSARWWRPSSPGRDRGCDPRVLRRARRRRP
jgi:phosphoenolpyruvate synthase/pyruvate phosphate dikinase